MPAGRFALCTGKCYFPAECWDTTKVSLKSSQLMDRLREEKGSGGRIFNAREMRRVWKTVQAGRTQAVQEERLQELFVTLEVRWSMNLIHKSNKFHAFQQIKFNLQPQQLQKLNSSEGQTLNQATPATQQMARAYQSLEDAEKLTVSRGLLEARMPFLGSSPSLPFLGER